jgi:hypothetical protein
MRGRGSCRGSPHIRWGHGLREEVSSMDEKKRDQKRDTGTKKDDKEKEKK